jgi:type IV pilus assembly protein PilB
LTNLGQTNDGRLAVKVGRLLGDSLVADGVISREQLDRALREAKANRELLGQALQRLGWASSDQILWALARQAGIEVDDLDTAIVDPELVRRFPESLLRAHRVLPLLREGHTLTAATSDIGNLAGVDELRRHSNLFVTLVAASEQQIVKQLDRVFAKDPGGALEVVHDRPSQAATTRSAPPAAGAPAGETQADDRSATMVVEQLLRKAIKEAASDIHIEPNETGIATRFRHDGMLRAGPTLPRAMYSSVLTRIKILANLNIAENRLPQDGRILHAIDDRRLDLRVSVFPTIHGENVAIRVLDKTRSFGLATLGMSTEELTVFRKCITRPHGLFLVTGPTGSGKTTTLYSALTEINTVERNIVTLEDPVEYELPGIRQTQVNTRSGLTFVVGLRALLRQDPDVMLVGEMRDLETVEIAIRAAMTGHLVFSTLHTNDALGAIPRLLDMGVPSYLLSSSLVGVLAQRLVRVICTQCRVKVSLSEAGAERLGELAKSLTTAYVGKGCKACGGRGYKGRIGVFEIVVPELLREVAKGTDPEHLKRIAAEKHLMVPMITQALAKVEAGVTTIDEVVRTVVSEVGA